eukprot:TRINITY_DN10162_c0_g1_i1.p1 TRINITY_DN10162_c0_g1~~TRINITY_DN10162_c0_g1_i1.p1  ORF type:complete len:1127 (-),score=274.09 TRINITY_DN10162_c0_g1_i1:93-3473(-)
MAETMAPMEDSMEVEDPPMATSLKSAKNPLQELEFAFACADETRRASGWQSVLDAVVPAIVALQVTAVRSFHDNAAGAHGGTGFVVDAKRGLMLTNRHVCTIGPTRATATFVGHAAMEEVSVEIAYVDPIHDFAFLRFDPQQLQQTPRKEIQLDPAGCCVGEEIRVVGNDSLEKLQILSGTIARIDRNAPELADDYHDENTFYALAGSGTRGGSSGSPVLNRHGKAVALNAAAATGTMHGFYLPLQRVARALEAVQNGVPVTRGTLCAQLRYASFPECLRLGLSKDFLQTSVLGREPAAGGTFSRKTPPSGMLQVRRCLPSTEADKVLRAGDILLEIEGEPCTDFVLFEKVLDEHVGDVVRLRVSRGEERLELKLTVRDLHTLLPRGFLELGLGVFHDVPYQTAQKHHVPLQGVYVAQAGFVFGEVVKSDAVILEVNGTACPDIRTFEELLQQIPEKEYFSVAWMIPKSEKERRRSDGFAKMQRQWGPYRSWTLDVQSRTWSPRRLASIAPSDEGTAAAASQVRQETRPLKKRRTGGLGALDNCICSVSFRTLQHFNIDLVADMTKLENDIVHFQGCGVVIDAKNGLVLTDRCTVPQPLGDIEVSLKDRNRSASVLFMHPNHSFVVLKLDSASADEKASFGEAAKFVDRALEPGDEVEFVGVDDAGRRLSSQAKVQDVRLSDFPRHWPPRWHERNIEMITIDDELDSASGGVLCNDQGQIFAFYAMAPVHEENEITYKGYGMPSHAILPMLRAISVSSECSTSGARRAVIASLELEFRYADLNKLRRLPPRLRPPAEWLKKLSGQSDSSDPGHALQVAGVTSDGPCDGVVEDGDLLVAVGGHIVTTAQAVEAQLRAAVDADAASRSSSSSSGAAVSSTAAAAASEAERWIYKPANGLAIAIRTQPEIGAKPSSWQLRPGTVFQVSETLRRDEVLYLKLADGRGWLFDRRPGVGAMCFQATEEEVAKSALTAASEGEAADVALTLLRKGKVKEVTVSVPLIGSDGARRLLCWNGLLLQEIPRSVREYGQVPAGVHVSEMLLGSPAEANAIEGDVVVAVDGIPTPNLDALLALEKKGGGRHRRVETADLSGRRFVAALEPNPLFWPVVEIGQNDQGVWACVEHQLPTE